MTALVQSYAYVQASAVRESPAGRTLSLETSGGATPAGQVANPRFFDGFLTAPTAAAAALLAVTAVAASRYYRPQPSAWLDPVVTANGDRLRMESFPGCCGVYARLDVLAPGLDGGDVGHVGHGTTNVDINAPLRRALARQAGLPPDRVRAALTVLGTSGQTGYDLAEEAYFHRHLPYSGGDAEARNPRLRGARALVADGAVRIEGALAHVGKGEHAYLVRTDDSGQMSCTCLWWAKYRGGRGPCKHVLAVGCAAKCGAKGQIAEVEAVANRTGASQTVKNARLLRDVLR